MFIQLWGPNLVALERQQKEKQMGRPLTDKWTGQRANRANPVLTPYCNIDGTENYCTILRQIGANKFLVQNINDPTLIGTVTLTNGDSNDPGKGYMTWVTSNATGYVARLSDNTVRAFTGGSIPWSIYEDRIAAEFVAYISDNSDYVNGDYPVPGSGAYASAATALSGVTYASKGTPYAPGGEINSVSNSASGLFRSKYDGNFSEAALDLPSTWDYTFFNTATLIKSIVDNDISFGNQTDGTRPGEHNFSIEWKGYIQAPASQNYNFFAESDDQIAMWIGTDAVSAPSNATRLLGSSNKALPGQAATAGVVNANSVTLVANKWYPVRIWFSEFTGGCKAQVYMQGADGTKYNGSDMTVAYNTATSGF